MAKDLVFISHATHQDNYPAGWLAAKLQALGYKVFLDLEDLRVGDTFYTVIQPKLQNETIKFITINTQHYIAKAANPNSGVRKEINAAATITGDNNFIIPLRFDSIDYSSYPMDYVGRNSIDFHNRWGDALAELVKEFEKLNVPKSVDYSNPIQLWHKAINNRNHVIEGPEIIHSNWFQINLPTDIYIYKPHQIDLLNFRDISATIIKEAHHLITFAKPDVIEKYNTIISWRKFSVNEFIESEVIQYDEEFTLIKPYDKLKNLLNKTFKSHCLKRGLKRYIQASQKEVFYFRFTRDSNKPINVSLKKYGKSRVQLNGNKSGTNWHFAINAKAELHPFPHYRVFYHVIFTDDANKPIEDTTVQQLFRKKFSSILYNKKTFELMLGAMLALSLDYKQDFIQIEVDDSTAINVHCQPLNFHSNTSYIEP